MKDNVNPELKDFIQNLLQVEDSRLANQKVLPRNIYDNEVLISVTQLRNL